MTALLRLYPRAWRDRYGDEFLALLESKPPDLLDRLDIVRGAVDARLHPQRHSAGAPDPADTTGRTSDRLVGTLVLLGAACLGAVLAIYAASPLVSDGATTYRDGSAAHPFFVAALALLAVGLLRTANHLPSTAEGGRGGAVLAAVFGVLWSLMPWVLILWVVATPGVIAVAVAARRIGIWSGLETGLVLGGLAVSWMALVIVASGLTTLGNDGYASVFLTLTMVWVGVGVGLLRWAPARHPAR
jgi:hypothetical protein